jgi:hypothetical protein
VLRGYVAEAQIARERAEQRNAFSDEHGYACDGETLNEAGAQKTLNGDASVDVEVMSAAGGQFRNDLRGSAGHLLDTTAAHRGEVEGLAAQDHHPLVAIGPLRKSHNCLESLAADHQRVDCGDELIVAVGFASALGQKVEFAVEARNETVDTGSD